MTIVLHQLSAMTKRVRRIAAVLIVLGMEATSHAQCTATATTFQTTGLRDGVYFQFHIPHTWHAYYTDQADGYTDGCSTTQVNCLGWDYSYLSVSDPGNFQVQVTWPGLGTFTATREDVIRNCDSIFKSSDGYDRNGGDLVFTKNCHGHTFNKDHWPLPDQYGVGPLVFCTETVSEQYASMLVHTELSHSIKVTQVEHCVDLENDWWIIKQVTEKSNISPIYTRTGGCYSGGIDASAAISGSYSVRRPDNTPYDPYD